MRHTRSVAAILAPRNHQPPRYRFYHFTTQIVFGLLFIVGIGGTNFDLSNWIKANKKNNKVISGIQTGLAPFGDDGFKCCGTAGEDFKILELEQWPTSVSNINKGLNLVWTISPNPTNGTVQVNFEKEFSGTLAVKDVEGKEVLVVNLRKTLRKELHLNHLPNGTYYINISNKQGKQAKKVVLRK